MEMTFSQPVSFFASDTARLLVHLGIIEKSNEILSVQRLLGELGLPAEWGLRLLVQVKANQQTLFYNVQRLREEQEPVDRHQTTHAARAWHETRRVEVLDLAPHSKGSYRSPSSPMSLGSIYLVLYSASGASRPKISTELHAVLRSGSTGCSMRP
jgi:hypothetical protein